jgi:para-aminobenzoate synthetase component I
MHLRNAFIEDLNQLGKDRVPFLFIIDFEELAPCVYPLSGIPANIRFALPGYRTPAERTAPAGKVFLNRQPMDYQKYLVAFEKVMHHLKQGNTYLVNLTFPTPVETGLRLDEIFEFSDAPYKLLVDNEFVVFSPEPFIRITNGMISSYPMKGTIDANQADAENKVLADPKESAEHTTIVDLIRNDLSKVAGQVEVNRYRYVERISTHEKSILQVSSEIRGCLPANFPERIGTILNELLPAGSICGAPKKRTLEIISEAEKDPRGYYTGIFGVFDGQDLDSAVMIRFIEKTDDGLCYRSGGGITHLSSPEKEYAEMLDKVYLPIRSDR